MCGINAVGDQGCGCLSAFCHTPLKIAVLLHKTANDSHSFSGTVHNMRTWQPSIGRHALLDTPLELRYGKFYNIISDYAQIKATIANSGL